MQIRNNRGQFVKGYTYIPTAEHRRKQSIAKLGKKRPTWVCKKISIGKKGKLTGVNSTNWRGGRIAQGQGYIWVYSPDHPYKTKDKYVLEHRLIMEEKIGRYLSKDEIVHHINHIPSDNRIENLIIMSKSFHNSTHHKGNINSILKGWKTRKLR